MDYFSDTENFSNWTFTMDLISFFSFDNLPFKVNK